ncbi:pentatricopeptide repeat-containing protein [Tanacetum coccineum]
MAAFVVIVAHSFGMKSGQKLIPKVRVVTFIDLGIWGCSICVEPLWGAGFCWIEAENQRYKFYVGDTFHPRVHLIHKKLDQLVTYIKKLGYVPDTDFILHELDKKEKEKLLIENIWTFLPYFSDTMAANTRIRDIPEINSGNIEGGVYYNKSVGKSNSRMQNLRSSPFQLKLINHHPVYIYLAFRRMIKHLQQCNHCRFSRPPPPTKATVLHARAFKLKSSNITDSDLDA